MTKIIVLPSEVSQKIAAGEVIERPYSVIKELAENSLDAHASSIKIELEEGGKRLIRVTDDGMGMARSDALICFERHSTSKLRDMMDLEAISTLGFRGEALPSISAVSRMTLITSTGEGDAGTRIRREAEETLDVSDAAHPRGTTIEVRNLFFNLPARRKFLRSERSEMAPITRFLTHLSLAHPKVRFSLRHGPRLVFDYPGVAGLRERIYQVYGKSMVDRLADVKCEHEGTRLRGCVSRPPTGRRDRKLQLIYVNSRVVRDKMLLAALNQAFSRFLEKDQSPEAFLFLDVPYADVDVNVHPAKTEVRFRDTGALYRFVHTCLEQAVIEALNVKEVYPAERRTSLSGGIEEVKVHQGFRHSERHITTALFPPPAAVENAREFLILGQYLDMYIIVSDPEGLLVVDQHNAHERILFERYEEIQRNRAWPRKQALLPQILEFSPSQVLSFEENQQILEEAGFAVEDMGGRSYALKEYPDIFGEEEARDVFLALLEESRGGGLKDKQARILATLACKTAVKAGEPLSLDKMTYLVENLRETENPALCPHGRPISVRLTKNEIEKGLKRR